jgi:hypothetical protein
MKLRASSGTEAVNGDIFNPFSLIIASIRLQRRSKKAI